jgi:colicin import membrane protein
MGKRERSLTKGRWRAITLSILLHGGIVAAAVYGWFTWKHSPPPPTTMAIEASVVDERALKGIAAPPKPLPPPPEPVAEPEPPPPEEQGPPKPDPAEVERKQEEERLAREKLEQEKLEQEKREQDRQEKEKRDLEQREQERLDAEKKEAEKQAAAKAAAEKAAAEKAAAEKRAAEKKKADEAAAAKKAADEKARLAREAELRRSLEAEERGNALRSGPEAARWINQIAARIARAWIRPPSARPGVTCMVQVKQVQGGDVTSVRVISCNVDDQALRDSVEAAVYRASPLPPPPDPALFQSTLDITFAPE